MKKYIAVIQARMGSSRLPGKVMKKVKGRYILDYVIERAKSSRCNDVIVCTTYNKKDDMIVEFCQKKDTKVFRGSENDVLRRIFEAVETEQYSTVVRITADSPLIDPFIINYLIDIHESHNNSVTTNYFTKSFPHGTIISLIDYKVLEYMNRVYKENLIREHIVFGFDKLPKYITVEYITAPKQWNRPDIKFDVDYEEDLELLKKIADEFDITGDKPSTIDIINFIDKNKDLISINDDLVKRWEAHSEKHYKKW
jgi:spore coat polysaccharide biosynthesis protein SpsF